MMKVQRLNKETKDPFALAHKYYQIISVLNDLRLAEGQIQLIAFTAIRGNISEAQNRKEYCRIYKTTPATINNIVDKLKKIKVILKENKMIFVNPALTKVDFLEPLALIVSLTLVSEIGIEPTLVPPLEVGGKVRTKE